MVKGKRTSSRQQVSRERIAQAKYAKQHGLISKRAKLQNSRLSRAVKKKIETLSILGAVPEYEFRAGMKSARQAAPVTAKPIKLPRKLRADAKAKGYQIFGGQIIAPNSQRKAFETAIKKGRLAGSVETPTGELFRVNLTGEGVRNYKELIDALKDGEIDPLLGDTGFYSFTFRDYHPKSGRTFMDGAELADYLEHYQFSEEEFDDFELWVLPEGESLGPTPDYVYDRDRASGRITSKKKKHRYSRRRRENQVISRTLLNDADRREIAREYKAKYRAKERKKIGDIEFKDKQRQERARRRDAHKPK